MSKIPRNPRFDYNNLPNDETDSIGIEKIIKAQTICSFAGDKQPSFAGKEKIMRHGVTIEASDTLIRISANTNVKV